jgi:predicted dinucleotide-binding enzyme
MRCFFGGFWMKAALIDKGNVGTAIAKGLSGKQEVKFGHREPNEPVTQAAKWGRIIILAVPHSAASEADKELVQRHTANQSQT